VTAAAVSALVIRKNRLKIVKVSKRMTRLASKYGWATKIATTEITFASAAGTMATAVALTKDTSIAKTVPAEILARTVMAPVLCIISEGTAIVTTKITIVDVAGMAATAVGTKIITITVRIALVMTPFSKVTIPACQGVMSTPGKVTGNATIAITNVVVIGMVATVARKPTRS